MLFSTSLPQHPTIIIIIIVIIVIIIIIIIIALHTSLSPFLFVSTDCAVATMP